MTVVVVSRYIATVRVPPSAHKEEGTWKTGSPNAYSGIVKTLPAATTPGIAMVVARGCVLGVIGLGIGVGSHLLGGGLLPGGASMLVLLVLSVAMSALLLRSWVGPLRLVLIVVAAQAGWHLVLSLLSGHQDDRATTMSAPVASSSVLLAHQLDHMAAQGVPMGVAHLLGAVALGLFLARGEAALWRLVSLAAAAAQLALARWHLLTTWWLFHPAFDLRPAPTAPVEVRQSQVLARSTLHRRGPPLLLAA